ncbi:hypothetical protein KUTeg_012578 [Tegillarca granosa]|uniref:Uncharacterized protein n=1 Tax=Tegillarca granosa TaxID=220873 RepID=A0ABQ9F010_TEGGR|nr:hypothetical protein KUTeg_012578 [Tegillarca granosa]
MSWTGEDAVAKSKANINEAENLPADQINQELQAKEFERVNKQPEVNPVDENIVNRGENKHEENHQNAESINKDEIPVDENKQNLQDSLVDIAKKEGVERKQEHLEIKNDMEEQKIENGVNEENKNNNIDNNKEPVQNVINEKQDKNQEHSHRIANDVIPQEFKELMEKVEKLKSANIDTAHGLPTLVTYGTRDNYDQVRQLVVSIQDFLPNTLIYVYDLNMEEWQKNTLKAGCHVRVKQSDILIFPEYISNLQNFHWRPLLLQIVLGHFRHIMWLEPGIRIKSSDHIRKLMQSRSKVLVIGQKAIYTTTCRY